LRHPDVTHGPAAPRCRRARGHLVTCAALRTGPSTATGSTGQRQDGTRPAARARRIECSATCLPPGCASYVGLRGRASVPCCAGAQGGLRIPAPRRNVSIRCSTIDIQLRGVGSATSRASCASRRRRRDRALPDRQWSDILPPPGAGVAPIRPAQRWSSASRRHDRCTGRMECHTGSGRRSMSLHCRSGSARSRRRRRDRARCLDVADATPRSCMSIVEQRDRTLRRARNTQPPCGPAQHGTDARPPVAHIRGATWRQACRRALNSTARAAGRVPSCRCSCRSCCCGRPVERGAGGRGGRGAAATRCCGVRGSRRDGASRCRGSPSSCWARSCTSGSWTTLAGAGRFQPAARELRPGRGGGDRCAPGRAQARGRAVQRRGPANRVIRGV